MPSPRESCATSHWLVVVVVVELLRRQIRNHPCHPQLCLPFPFAQLAKSCLRAEHEIENRLRRATVFFKDGQGDRDWENEEDGEDDRRVEQVIGS